MLRRTLLKSVLALPVTLGLINACATTAAAQPISTYPVIQIAKFLQTMGYKITHAHGENTKWHIKVEGSEAPSFIDFGPNVLKLTNGQTIVNGAVLNVPGQFYMKLCSYNSYHIIPEGANISIQTGFSIRFDIRDMVIQ